MKYFLFMTCLLFATSTFAQAAPTSSEKKDTSISQKVDSAADKVAKAAEQTKEQYAEAVNQMSERREASWLTLMGHYAPISMWIPSKYGASAGYVKNKNLTFEIEALYGSLGYEFLKLNLANFSETRVNLMARYFPAEIFNILFGLHYEKLELVLGDKFLSTISGTSKSEFSLLEIDNVGVVFGLGSRWQLEKGITLGVDWVTLNQPILSTKTNAKFLSSDANQADKDLVNSALTVLKYTPRLTVLNLSAGWTF